MSIAIKITCDGCGTTRESTDGDVFGGRVTSRGWDGWWTTAFPVRHYCRACGERVIARASGDGAAMAAEGEHGE